MVHEVFGAQEPQLFGAEGQDRDRTFRRVPAQQPREFEDRSNPRGVVVRSVSDGVGEVRVARAEGLASQVVVMRPQNHDLAPEGGVLPFDQRREVGGGEGSPKPMPFCTAHTRGEGLSKSRGASHRDAAGLRQHRPQLQFGKTAGDVGSGGVVARGATASALQRVACQIPNVAEHQGRVRLRSGAEQRRRRLAGRGGDCR